MPGKTVGISSRQFLCVTHFPIVVCCLPSNPELLSNYELILGHPVSGSTPWAGQPRGWVHPVGGSTLPLGDLAHGGPSPWGDPALRGTQPQGGLSHWGTQPLGGPSTWGT